MQGSNTRMVAANIYFRESAAVEFIVLWGYRDVPTLPRFLQGSCVPHLLQGQTVACAFLTTRWSEPSLLLFSWLREVSSVRLQVEGAEEPPMSFLQS